MQGLSTGRSIMPPVREIDCSDGIRIVGTHGIPQVKMVAADIVALPGNQAKKEQRLNEWLQQQYESRHLLSEYDPDHRVRQPSPQLHVWERIKGDYLVVTLMWVKVHIINLSPLKLLPGCQNKELGPIRDEWWLSNAAK